MVAYLEQKYYQINPANSYQWQFDRANLVGATNSFLSLINVAASASGSYSVIVSNSAGSTQSSNAVLLVGLPPPSSPSHRAGCLSGTNVALSVTASGTSLFYQWFQNGVELDGQTNSTLILSNVSASNAGRYTVVVSNFLGPVTSLPATLTVVAPPLIVVQPQSQTVLAGSSVSLFVAALGGGSSCPFPPLLPGRCNYG